MCAWKARYTSWEAAEADGIHVWRSKPRRPNPATPYPCDLCGGYHLAQSPVVRRKSDRRRLRVA